MFLAGASALRNPGWLYRNGAEIILTLGLIPIILATGYRMFPSMLGLRQPNDRGFDTGVGLWVLGWGLKIGIALSPTAALITDGIVFLATLALMIALRINERPHHNAD